MITQNALNLDSTSIKTFKALIFCGNYLQQQESFDATPRIFRSDFVEFNKIIESL
jgi:hypothetical protein